MRMCCVALCLLTVAGCDSAPVAEVDGETLVGAYHIDTGVAAFLGVPFAEAPLGPLRWQAPQALRSRVSRRQTIHFAPACMQSPRILDWYRDMAEIFGASRDVIEDLAIGEDCLYLNIWTPSMDPAASLPVMVYIHGGSNNSGWSYEPNYHGHALAERDVVVVSIAYRVGVFGFLSHPDAPPDSPVANFGLWDQIAALQWVQQHIGKFGGDANRVTAFGESAGAEDIVALMFAEHAQGLFHRVILESTAGFGLDDVPTLASEQLRGIGLANALGIDGDDVLDQLREVPADVVLEIYDNTYDGYYHSPAVDGQLIVEPTWSRIATSDFGDYEVIIGTNAHEWYDTIGTGVTVADVERVANELYHIDRETALAAVADESDPQYALDRLYTADQMLCPSQYLAGKVAESGHDAWMYYFTRIRDGDGGAKLGAYHGAEYIYVFDTHDAWMPTTDIDRALTQLMSRYWVEFAKTGDPNSSETPDWPLYQAPDFLVQELGDRVTATGAPEQRLCRRFADSHTLAANHGANDDVVLPDDH